MPTKKNTPKKSKLKAKNTPRKPLVEKPSSNRVSELTEPRRNAASDAYGGGALYTAEYVAQHREFAYQNGKSEAEDKYFIGGIIVSSCLWILVCLSIWFVHG
jgi:hypothetical protein